MRFQPSLVPLEWVNWFPSGQLYSSPSPEKLTPHINCLTTDFFFLFHQWKFKRWGKSLWNNYNVLSPPTLDTQKHSLLCLMYNSIGKKELGYHSSKGTLVPGQPPIHSVLLEIIKISTLVSFAFLGLINLLLGIKHFSRAKFKAYFLTIPGLRSFLRWKL